MDVHDYAEENKVSLKQIMDFTTCTNPLGPSTRAQNALRKHIKDLDIAPDRKARYLTSFIARSEAIDKGNLILGEGSMSLLHATFRAEQTRTVLAAAPVSREYEEVILRNGLVLKQVPPDVSNPFSISLERIVDSMKEVDTVLVPYPHDILGDALDENSLSTLINETDKQGKTLIIDEAYREFTTLHSPVKDVVKSDKAVILRTFSAYYALAGLPMGYAIGSAEMIGSIQKRLVPGEANTFAVQAAINSLKDKLYKSRTAAFIDEEKKFFRKSFASIEGLQYSETPCPFFLLKIEVEPERLEEVFSRYNILIDDLLDINGSRYLRVPLRKHKWNARFLKTLKNALGVHKS